MIPVAITAAPRDPATQLRCFESVRRTGFAHVIVCAEPETQLPIDTTFHWIISHKRLGQWRNFIRALQYLLQFSDAERFCTFEDDVVFCKNVASYLESLAWPSEKCGCLHLYTSAFYADYPVGRVSQLKVEHSLDMFAACALVFTRAAAQTLVDWARDKGWRGHTRGIITEPDQKQGVDTYIGEVLVQTGFEIWIHNPSLADHIGVESTLGHTGDADVRFPLNFPGEEADARLLMEALA